MAHGSRETLEQELEALLRQRDQYSLALDAATDPQASIRLQRTLERLEDEIEGLREALAALKPGTMEAAPAPDWEDEPATAIFDPDIVPAPVPIAARPEPEPEPPEAKKPSEELTDPAAPLYDIDAEMQHARGVRLSATPPSVGGPARKYGVPVPVPSSIATEPPIESAPAPAPSIDPEPDPEPGAAEPLPAVDPTVNVTPPPVHIDEPRDRDMLFAVDLPTVAWRPEDSAREAAVRRFTPRPFGSGPDPLGPVVLDALEPPTGENPREEEPSDPFALPRTRASGTDWERPFSPTPVDDASPFGSTDVSAAAFDASTFTDTPPEQEWSAGSKILLAVVVLGFLAAVGWVLTM